MLLSVGWVIFNWRSADIRATSLILWRCLSVIHSSSSPSNHLRSSEGMPKFALALLTLSPWLPFPDLKESR